MSKKDKEKLNSINNPFSLLKGLSVSAQQKNDKKKGPLETPSCPEPSSDPSLEPIDEVALFEQAMGQLGVSQTTQDDVLARPEPSSDSAADVPEPNRQREADHRPGGTKRQFRKAARRMGEPEASLDLHGVPAAEAVRKVDWFLENANFHGCRVVLIVTGKGAHSESGPVLRPLVEAYLAGPGQRFVVEWIPAPKSLGGEGALLAALHLPVDVG